MGTLTRLRALVTGDASGIDLATARHLTTEGAPVAILDPVLPDAPYSASKGAVLALTRAMAADLLPEGIRVNAVNPGTADTAWIGRLLARADDPVAERAALASRQPHGRLVTAEEVAGAIGYLASPAAGSVTGTTLAAGGGMEGLRLRGRR